MKKFLSLILSCAMCFSTVMATGCSDEETSSSSSSSSEPPVIQVTEWLEMENDNVVLTLGDRKELSVSYEEIEGATLTWSSSAPSVVSVDENGYIEALAVGSATITAQYGSKKATCAVEVGLSGNVPLLMFDNNVDEQITVMRGTEFGLGAYVKFNGRNYEDCNVEYYVADESIGAMNGDKFVAKDKSGSTQVSVFATWRGQTVHARTVDVRVVSESTVLLNDGKLMSLNLYTVSELEGSQYATEQTISSVYVSEDNVEITEYEISVLDEGIASLERSGDEWVVRANKAGKTNLIVSYGENEFSFDIWVNRPVAESYKTVEYSVRDQKWFDEESGTMKPIEDLITNLGNIVAYEYGGKEYKNKGGALNMPVGVPTVVTLYNEQVGYLVDMTSYTMILDELQDFVEIYAGETEKVVEGHFILAKDLIEPDAVLSMPAGMVPNDFAGTFDGKGHVLSFTLVHGTTHAFGIFGKTFHGATIKNLAMSGVKQTGTGGKNPAGVLCAQGSKQAGTPEYRLENLFIDVSFIEEGSNFLAVMGNVMWSGILKNVIVHIDGEIPKGFEISSFARGSLISSTNSYLISASPLYEIDVEEDDKPDQTKWVKIVQYASYEEMMNAGNNYTSFSAAFWDMTTYGVPVWKTLVQDFTY